MEKRRLRAVLVTLFAVIGMSVIAIPASADVTGEEGCTPGYWKNHTDNWLEDEEGNRSYETDDLFSDIFGVDHGDVTLLEALDGGGGSGIAGAQEILARAATAALLNSAHEGLGYPLRRDSATAAGPAIFDAVQYVWDSGSRRKILKLARFLDELNNLGCPLN
ncbi:MAG TPA: hypothetical protein VGC47_09165 [Acidimicrobiia bacterium]|jgi:hypothetical protein